MFCSLFQAPKYSGAVRYSLLSFFLREFFSRALLSERLVQDTICALHQCAMDARLEVGYFPHNTYCFSSLNRGIFMLYA